MEQRISLVTLGVEDISRSKKFYEGLGFATTWNEEKGVIFFKTVGMALALYPLVDLIKDIGPGAGNLRKGFSGVTLAHNTREKTEVSEILAMVEALGGRVIKPAQEAFWGGVSGYFEDPDGHLWEIAWGAFPLLADGSLDIP